MKIIAGLGNPGPRYARTRHNVGFRVLDRLADQLKVSFDREKYRALMAEASYKGTPLLLLKPQTYMNLSGESVARAVKYRNASTEDDVLLVVDDVNLPLGRVRMREGGSSGGHNGLKSVTAHLGTDQYPRLRIGIGSESGDLTDFVLGKFAPEEEPFVEQAVHRAADAVLCFIENGTSAAMSRFNG